MEGPALLLTLVPVMRGGLECNVKQVQYRDLLGSVTLSYYSPVHSVIVSSQPLTVVTLVISQMVNAVSPVQPTTL